MPLSFNNTPVEVVTKKRLKNITIRLDRHTHIKINSPTPLSDTVVNDLLNQHKKWIIKKQEKLKNKVQPLRLNYDNTDVFPYLGKNYDLQFITDQKNQVSLTQNKLIIYGPFLSKKEKQKALFNWVKIQATEIISDRIEIHQKEMNLTPKQVRFKKLKSRWGSCSSKANLNFNWQLIMAPLEIVDYVVIHELAHLKEMNHSQRFWEIVKYFCPQYKLKIKWLRDNGLRLNLDQIDS